MEEADEKNFRFWWTGPFIHTIHGTFEDNNAAQTA